MKSVEFKLNGKTYHLLLNAAALFDCYDRFGDGCGILDHITGTTAESYNDTVWILCKLAQQGELLRRYQGEEPEKMLSVDDCINLSPDDIIVARNAIRKAYSAGFEREINTEDEEIDLGLAELQKKTELESKRQSILTGLRKRFG